MVDGRDPAEAVDRRDQRQTDCGAIVTEANLRPQQNVGEEPQTVEILPALVEAEFATRLPRVQARPVAVERTHRVRWIDLVSEEDATKQIGERRCLGNNGTSHRKLAR